MISNGRYGGALKDHGIKWMEEFLPPDDYEGLGAASPAVVFHAVLRRASKSSLEGEGRRYAEVKKALRGSGLMLSTAEHEYTRYGFRRLIQDRSVDILQPDITWLGGLTEARRVVAMAARGVGKQ